MADERHNTRESERHQEGPARHQEKPAEEKERLDEKLDEALEETFPASDPIAVTPKDEDDSD